MLLLLLNLDPPPLPANAWSVTEAQAIEIIAEQFAAQWPTLTAALPGGPFPFALKDEALPSSDAFALCTWMGVVRNQITLSLIHI